MKKADNFSPAKWLVENKLTSQSKLNEEVSNDVKQFLRNRYRVLLTRFRHGMVIWIPEGSDVDLTRSKTLIDDTYNLFKDLGLREI
jgi:DUF2075 family protein